MDLDSVFSSDTEDEAASAAKVEARLADSRSLKEQGNAALKAGKLDQAKSAYKKALSKIWDLYKQRANQDSVGLGVSLDLNLALCHLKAEDWELAIGNAGRALEADPFNVKGLYRRGVAHSRLGLLSAAETDLAGALAVQSDAATRKELVEVRQRRASDESGGQDAVPKGFFGKSESCTSNGPQVELEDGEQPCGADAQRSSDSAMHEQHSCAEPPYGGDGISDDLDDADVCGSTPAHAVQDALEKVHVYLSAIADRRVVCASVGEREALLELLDDITGTLPQAKASIENAAIDQELVSPDLQSPDGVVDVETLLERMASGLECFRPHFSMQERRAGEFDAVRIVRELVDKDTSSAGGVQTQRQGPRGFDLELLIWGDADAATPDNVAEPLFPPTGKPGDADAVRWQREAFHRVFQKDVSKYACGAVWMILGYLIDHGVGLSYKGRRVVELGIAHGLFFASPVPDGPQKPSSWQARAASIARSRADSLAICMGMDKRLVVLHSFGSLGVVHKWLLLRLEGQECYADRADVYAVDVCAGALGLLEGDRLVRYWDHASDDRFVCRCCRWGPTATALANASYGSSATTTAAAQRFADWQRLALIAMLARSGLQMSAEDVLSWNQSSSSLAPTHFDGGDEMQSQETARTEIGQRVCAGIDRLGLLGDVRSAVEPLSRILQTAVPDDSDIDTAQHAAVSALVSKKLRAAGLQRLADRSNSSS